jgi:transcriptional regulator with XRE-family HTH domain
VNAQEGKNEIDLGEKIARLVEERGWNQEEFARIARLNRHTARHILKAEGRHRLRNATVSACARALGLTVNELQNQPLERLLSRMAAASAPQGAFDALRRLQKEATEPALLDWLERHPERAGGLSADDVNELLALQGTGVPLTAFSVEAFVERLERRKRLLEQVHVIAGTGHLDLLEQIVALLYEKVQPYRGR